MKQSSSCKPPHLVAGKGQDQHDRNKRRTVFCCVKHRSQEGRTKE